MWLMIFSFIFLFLLTLTSSIVLTVVTGIALNDNKNILKSKDNPLTGLWIAVAAMSVSWVTFIILCFTVIAYKFVDRSVRMACIIVLFILSVAVSALSITAYVLGPVYYKFFDDLSAPITLSSYPLACLSAGIVSGVAAIFCIIVFFDAIKRKNRIVITEDVIIG